ncbi:MAG: hypothetical protein H0X27_10870 [Caulobacteraceae bacterium]|nr:hypothetical protein [Caulobacteraceae bacterium]
MINAMVGNAKAPSEGLDLEGCRAVVGRVFEEFHRSDLENLIWSYEGMALAARNWDAPYLERILAGAEVRIVFFARYVDDWVESLVKERIRGRRGARAESLTGKPLKLAPAPEGADGEAAHTGRSMLEKGAKIVKAVRVMRQKAPSAEIVALSFDEHRAKGKLVSGALAAMGVPVDAFPDADDEAGVKNPTKSDLYSMLLYHLVMGRAAGDVIRAVGLAGSTKDKLGHVYEPLAGRRFRFLSDENIIQARGYYEELRRDYPTLPAQPPYAPRPAERRLSKAEGVAVLDWLRPDISDAVFAEACAAYPEDAQG